MKPWKAVSLILFALAVAAAGYGLDSRATRLQRTCDTISA